LRRHTPAIRRLGVAKLWLYGSVARGDATKASDVDLLVDLEPSADRKRRLATTAFRP
jgi:hypothetical protein